MSPLFLKLQSRGLVLHVTLCLWLHPSRKQTRLTRRRRRDELDAAACRACDLRVQDGDNLDATPHSWSKNWKLTYSRRSRNSRTISPSSTSQKQNISSVVSRGSLQQEEKGCHQQLGCEENEMGCHEEEKMGCQEAASCPHPLPKQR